MEPEEGIENKARPDVAAKRPYRSPGLVTFGSVAALTRQTNCTADNDGNSACNPAGTNMSMLTSDPAAKENCVRVGTHPLGFGLYLFDYAPTFRDACGHGRQFGVMADEVESVVPSAVSRDAAGYRRVDYAALGITPARR